MKTQPSYRRLRGRWLFAARAVWLAVTAVSVVLILLLIPPLVFREDGRGLHDLWTDSGAYRKVSAGDLG